MSIPWGSTWDIEIFQGGGFEQPFELYESLPDGAPDLTAPINFLDGTTAKAQCREKERLGSTLIADFEVIVADNILTLKLTGEQTEAISVTSGHYDVFVTEPGAEPQMFVEGKVTVNRAVTTESP
jgi:hypothetical protein